MTKEVLPTRLGAAHFTPIEMAINFTEEQLERIFTNPETSHALKNKGYVSLAPEGFDSIELLDIIYAKYGGEITITFKSGCVGFVALFSDKEIFDSAIFDRQSPLVNAFGHLLLILDNKLYK